MPYYYMNELVFVVTPLLTAFIFAFLYWAIDKRNQALKLLFLLATIIFIFTANAQNLTLSQVNNATANTGTIVQTAMPNHFALIFIIIITIALILIYWIKAYMEKMSEGVFNRDTHEYNDF